MWRSRREARPSWSRGRRRTRQGTCSCGIPRTWDLAERPGVVDGQWMKAELGYEPATCSSVGPGGPREEPAPLDVLGDDLALRVDQERHRQATGLRSARLHRASRARHRRSGRARSLPLRDRPPRNREPHAGHPQASRRWPAKLDRLSRRVFSAPRASPRRTPPWPSGGSPWSTCELPSWLTRPVPRPPLATRRSRSDRAGRAVGPARSQKDGRSQHISDSAHARSR